MNFGHPFSLITGTPDAIYFPHTKQNFPGRRGHRRFIRGILWMHNLKILAKGPGISFGRQLFLAQVHAVIHSVISYSDFRPVVLYHSH